MNAMTEPARFELPTFDALVAALGRRLGHKLDPTPGVLSLIINNVDFVLAYDPAQWGPENVMLACDFGDIPPTQDRVAVLEALLKANTDLHGVWSPVFSLHPASGRVTSMVALPLLGLDADQAMLTFSKHVLLVDAWRRSYFLDPDDLE